MQLRHDDTPNTHAHKDNINAINSSSRCQQGPTTRPTLHTHKYTHIHEHTLTHTHTTHIHKNTHTRPMPRQTTNPGHCEHTNGAGHRCTKPHLLERPSRRPLRTTRPQWTCRLRRRPTEHGSRPCSGSQTRLTTPAGSRCGLASLEGAAAQHHTSDTHTYKERKTHTSAL